MSFLHVVLSALQAAKNAAINTFREHGVASPRVGLSVNGRTVARVIREFKVGCCPETLIIARFDDGFYGVAAEKNNRLRFFDAYPFNEQFTQLAACMEQVPVVVVMEEPPLHTIKSVEVQVSADYGLIFDINVGNPNQWDLRGFTLLSRQVEPESGHRLDGANLRKLNSMIFDPKALDE